MRESMTALPSHEHYKGYIYIYTHTYTYTHVGNKVGNMLETV